MKTWPLMFTIAWYATSASPPLMAVTLTHLKTAGARTWLGKDCLKLASVNHQTSAQFLVLIPFSATNPFVKQRPEQKKTEPILHQEHRLEISCGIQTIKKIEQERLKLVLRPVS